MYAYRFARTVLGTCVLAGGLLFAHESVAAEETAAAGGSAAVGGAASANGAAAANGTATVAGTATGNSGPANSAAASGMAASGETTEDDDDNGRGEGDEAFDGADRLKPGMYSFRTLTQLRYEQTSPDISARVAELTDHAWADTDPTDDHAKLTQERLNVLRDLARKNDGFEVHRMFLRAAAQPTKWASMKLLVDFAELLRKNQKGALKLAYAELTPWNGVMFTVGYFKIPFSLLELLPIADFELADVGPNDDMIKDLGVGGRDLGAMVTISPLERSRWLHLSLGVFKGDNEGAQDYRGPGVVAGRIVSRPFKFLRIGADVAVRPDRITDVSGDTMMAGRYSKYDSGATYSADVTVSHKGFELRTEILAGDRMDSDHCLLTADCTTSTPLELHRGGARHYLGAWALARYQIPIYHKVSLMPVVRAEWIDLDSDRDASGAWFLTGGLNLDFSDRVRVLWDVTRRVVQAGTLNPSSHPGTDSDDWSNQYWLDATTGIMQVQLKM